jgi:omega-hydroxy-beta-dihydromenaquinone-9 sulfotransferase
MFSSSCRQEAKKKPERKFSPRIWLGCDFFPWLRIMTRGRFQFTLPHLHIGLCASAVSFGQMMLKFAQGALYRDQIDRTAIEHPPIFIIGHWRTGTTLLHEMMVLDPRHSYMNTYECLQPHHYLLTEDLFRRWFSWLLPQRRPMDNMHVGWERPQEDEFALCLLGQPSPYLDLAFPNLPPLTPGALDLEGLSASARRDWKRAFFRLLQTHTFKDPRRLVLKSPPHSCRIPTLLELFPEARFVHIVRNPYDVFPSSVNLWKTLAEKHSVHTPHHRDVVEKVMTNFEHLYQKLHESKKLVHPSRFHEMRYEDLVCDPIGEMRNLYRNLDLGGFDNVRPWIADYWERNAHYETNQFSLTAEQRQEVTRRWGDVIRHYGYPIVAGEQAAPLMYPVGGKDSIKAPERAPARKKSEPEVATVS